MSFLGFFLAIVFGAISIYTTFFFERKPDLKLIVLGNTTVYDIREDVPKLDILFDNSSIKQSGQTLSIITAKIINDGSQGITKSSYDDSDPLGFVVEPGKLINAEVLDASDPYLKKNLSLSVAQSNKITIAPLIIDAGEFFSLKMLVLHDKIVVPNISPIGKIVGIKSIKIDLAYKNVGRRVWWRDAFAGSFWIQITRIVGYCIGLFGSLILFAISATSISGWRDDLRTKKLLKEFDATVATKTPQLEAAKEWYQRFGLRGVLLIQRLMSDEKELRVILDKHLAGSFRPESIYTAHEMGELQGELQYMELECIERGRIVRHVGGSIVEQISRVLLGSGFVKYDKKVLQVDPALFPL